MKDESNPANDIVPVNAIRVETGISRYPLHRLARKGSVNISISIAEQNGDKTSWEVDYSSKHGQPGPLAYKLDTLVINRRIEEASRPIPRMLKLGSLSDICRELSMADSGKNRSDIKKSLYQNAFAGITAKTRFRLTDGTQRDLEAGFTRYSVIFTGEKLPDGRKADGVYITLNDTFINVINGAMTRPLDYDYLKSLPPAPQRFYELLSYQMYAALKYDRPRAKLVYSEFCAHAPLTRHTNWENVRSQMNKIHRPHKLSGYIAKVDFQQIEDASGKPDWIMLYMPGPKARSEYRAFARRGGPNIVEIAQSEEPPQPLLTHFSELEAELVKRGVTQAVAANLVAQHSGEKITAQLERLDWVMDKTPRKIKDTGAYLAEAIRKDFAPPDKFVSRAEIERRKDASQAKERQQNEEQIRKQAANRREREVAERVKAFRKTRTPEQLVQLEAEAIAQADENARQSLSDPALKQFHPTMVSMLVKDHIARLIQANETTAEPA